jgi:hypothetical protein
MKYEPPVIVADGDLVRRLRPFQTIPYEGAVRRDEISVPGFPAAEGFERREINGLGYKRMSHDFAPLRIYARPGTAHSVEEFAQNSFFLRVVDALHPYAAHLSLPTVSIRAQQTVLVAPAARRR